LGIRGTFNSNPCNQLGGLLVRDGVVVVMTAASDWDVGGEIDEDRDPEQEAKLNETRHKTSKMSLAQNLFGIWIGFDSDKNI